MTNRPLYVDLDGTLLATDTLWESIFLLLRHRPIAALLMPLWLLKGKAHFKSKVADHVIPDPASLPYREDVLEFLRLEKASNRRIILATATDARVAKRVADYVGLFDGVIATENNHNRRGESKLAAIRADCANGEFDYVGNSHIDLPIWRGCKGVYVAGAGSKLMNEVNSIGAPVRVFASSNGIAGALAKVIRPHQWAKNLLVFLPVILAHEFTNLPKLFAAILAFFCFCTSASAAYVLNDLLDVEHDRHHPTKRQRPFASGALPLSWGPMIFLALLVLSFGVASILLPWRFVVALLIYFVTTSAYSLYLKSKLLIDVITLALLYTLRVIAGAHAVDVPLTNWLLAFCMFIFLSLALAKRYVELLVIEGTSQDELKGRSYRQGDMSILESAGLASGYMAVLVFAMYIDSELVKRLYRHPNVLWMICPLLIYWITRIWFFARRRALPDDPIIFALRDGVSLAVVALAVVLILLAHPVPR